MSKTQLQLLQEFFSANQQQTLDIRERDEGKVLTVLQALTSDATWEDGYKSIQDIRAGVVSTFDENEKEWKGRRVGSALRLLNLRESRVSHGLTQYLIKKAKVDNIVARFHLNASEPEPPTSEISSTISPISTRHAQNHEQRVEKVSKESKIWATDISGAGRDGEQGEHHTQTASLPTSTRSTNGTTHRDRPLHEDYVLRTILPAEETQIGYATLERLSYTFKTRFPDLPKSEVLELLARLEEKRLIEQKPFPRCWRCVR